MINQMEEKRFESHAHTYYSNLRGLDCITSPQALIDRAIEMGLSGIAITDHESLSSHIEVNQYALSIKEKYPNFKIGLGDEIYLVDERGQDKHYHFILIAKDSQGHRQLRELSSIAWINSYFAKGIERVDTLKSDLERIVKKNPGHLIASTACLGSELDNLVLNMTVAEKIGDDKGAREAHDKIVDFILWCLDLFKDDFYIECQPNTSKEQISVNKRLISIAHCFKVKMIVTTDSHYLKKEDRYVHKAYLTSREAEREVDAFYESAYLQSNQEIIDNLKLSSYDELFVEEMFQNSMEICNKIEEYSLLHSQQIPQVEVKNYPKKKSYDFKHKELNRLLQSDDIIDRYWVNECLNKLEELYNLNGLSADLDVYLDELEEEAEVKIIVGERLGTNMFRYPVLLQKYIDLIWECGSSVGAGRGSACSALNHWLLGITQLDPIKWNFPFFRYINRDTDSLGDIDIDIMPSKRPAILEKIKQQRSMYFDEDIDNLAKKNFGCTLIATFTTEGVSSAIQSACRGYRSEDFPDGIEIDEAQYIASLVPSERGESWKLDDLLYGNEEKGRKPSATFINKVNSYPGLLDIIRGISGCIKTRSSHASGVIMFDNDPYEHTCFMKTPNGEIITQYDLHCCEAAGLTKLDFLVTDIQEKIIQTLKFLQEDNLIEKDYTIRQAYEKYLHPNVLPIDDKDTWKTIQNAASLDLFQLDSDIGRQGAKKVKPKNMQELSATNGLIRLMAAEKGAMPPMEKYIKIKLNPKLWEEEMDNYGLTEANKEAIRPYLRETYGIGISQEQLMRVLMDENICGFTLKEANKARKVVSKKRFSEIENLKKMVKDKAVSPVFGKYIWDSVVVPQLGYSFSEIHSLSYSYIGYQSAYLATHWNSIYWNTACLVVNSGSLEEDEEETNIVDIYEPEDWSEAIYEDLPDRSGKKKIEKNTDYGKIAKALGSIISAGIKVSLVDINKSQYSFKPDAENNQILFGMKALSCLKNDIIQDIISKRPYKDIKDFMNRCPLKKPAMISLIKAGAFDNLEQDFGNAIGVDPRYIAMAYYISVASKPKFKLNLQNFSGLISKGLIPQDLASQKQAFLFNNYIKKNKFKTFYKLDNQAEDFYKRHYDEDKLLLVDGILCINQKVWDKIYQSEMDKAREWLKSNQETVLKEFNYLLFKETWDNYAKGNLSSWEMESLCFYYHEHELINVDRKKYGIESFHDLSIEPEVDYYYQRAGRKIPIFKIHRIMGAVIGKNNARSSITLLTVDGIVNVKFTKEYYAMYNRRISEIQEDGIKKIVDQSWFKRGNLLMIQGYRRDDAFNAKTYKNTNGHQLYKIELENNGKDMILTHDRVGEEE